MSSQAPCSSDGCLSCCHRKNQLGDSLIDKAYFLYCCSTSLLFIFFFFTILEFFFSVICYVFVLM